MSSRDRVDVMRPGGRLVVEGAGLEAAVQDAYQPVGQLTQGRIVSRAAISLPVVVGPRSGRGFQRGERLRHQRVNQPVIMDEPRQRDLLLPRRTGNRRGPGVVL